MERWKTYAILAGVGTLLVLGLIIWGLYVLGGADQSALERLRDIAVIFVVLLFLLVVVILAGISPRTTDSCASESVWDRNSVGARSSCLGSTSIPSVTRWSPTPASMTNLVMSAGQSSRRPRTVSRPAYTTSRRASCTTRSVRA